MNQTLPPTLETVFAQLQSPEALFQALLPEICQVLQTDRCFLHVRKPSERLYQNFCWRRRPDLPDTSTDGWQPEDHWEEEDPMFAAALRCAAPIFVEDIETASPDVLNVEFERNYMGHRALVHAHICQDGALRAILQPCLFGQPRVWSEFDRSVIIELLDRLKPYVIRYADESPA
jgi:GAF domain-containing protein